MPRSVALLPWVIRDGLRRGWRPCVAALGLWSSVDCTTTTFSCTDDAQCEGAGPSPRCEAIGACSIDDPSCAGGRRYADGAGPLTGQCVDVGGTTGGSTTGTTGADETTEVDETNGTDTTSTSTGPVIEVEVCDGIDNDGDGLVDEVSPSNEECGECRLGQHEAWAYWACPEPRSWADAVDECELLGASLAIIESPEQNEWATEFAQGQSLWLGAQDIDQEGDWRWLDGTPLPIDHPAWGPGQPDDDGPLREGGEDCLHLSGEQLFEPGDWNDDICGTAPYGALCRAPHGL